MLPLEQPNSKNEDPVSQLHIGATSCFCREYSSIVLTYYIYEVESVDNEKKGYVCTLPASVEEHSAI